MAVDIQKMFNEDLPTAIKGNEAAAKGVGAKFQINITGAGGGEWFVNASDSGPSVTPGKGEGAECTITIADEDFQKLVEDPKQHGMAMFFSGKLKVAGNPMLAQKLGDLFALGRAKPAS